MIQRLGGTMLTHSEIQRYLSLLRVPAHEPDLDALTEIVRAHVMTVPFENISKLYRWKTSRFQELTSVTQFLDGIEEYHFGGTCYSNNYHLNQLLAGLGYDVVLCGAAMSKPDVHIVNIVKMDGKEYIVDAGYAAPFLVPLPLDLSNEYVVSLGTDRYVLSPRNAIGQSRLTLYRNGTAQHGYLINPMPRNIGEFSRVIADSFRPDATFMNAVLLVRFGEDDSIVLHNMTHIESKRDMARRQSLKTMDELITAIDKYFSIPPSISKVVLDGFLMRQDAWG